MNLQQLISDARTDGIVLTKAEISRKAGFNKEYLNKTYRDCLYYTTICLIAEKKGVDLLAILNLKGEDKIEHLSDSVKFNEDEESAGEYTRKIGEEDCD